MARRRDAEDAEMNEESGNDGNDAEESVNNNQNNNDNDEEQPPAAARAPDEEPSLLEQLMERIRNFLASVDAPESAIDEDQARRLLEASAGDVNVAESLCFDHYFASMERRNNRRPAEDNEEESPRRVRRRLEEELADEAAENPNENNMNQEQPPQEANNNDDPPAAEEEEEANEAEEMPPPALPANRRRRAARADNNEGAAVSDDEGPQRPSRRSRRRVRIPRQGQDDADGEPLRRNISIEAGSELEEQPDEVMRAPVRENQIAVKKEEEQEEEDHEDLDCDFLCDHDWIFQEDSSASPVMPPVLLLWGDPSKVPPPEEEGDSVPHVAERSNVVAEDDDEDEEDNAPPEPPKEGIPKTWIHAGFSASSCGTGLVTQPPDDKDSTIYRVRQSQNSGTRNIAPPPYHCNGVTALLSIVTALMYSGASIQGPTVNCSKARKPFSELSEEERKREFDSRLADALSSLVWVAAKTSLERKKRALAKRNLVSPPGSGDDDKLRQQTIERRMGLVPTCRFEDDSGTGDGRLAEGRLVQIATSYTSFEDIHSYVVSTVRSFKKKGGCALFLETIIRIHGKACVDRMLRHARRKASLPATDVLIECKCEERQKKLSHVPPYGALNQPVEEPLPLDHTCITTELVSLLLTGEVHSGFQGWSTGGLGIGLLSGEQGEVGRQLMRPQKPVWILRGDAHYSVAWLDGTKEHLECIWLGDRPGALHHWNGWFGVRHKTSMRLITARREWSPPAFSKVRAAGSDRKTVLDGIMARRREQSHIVSSDEHGEDESDVASITKQEIEQVKVHPDDEKLFPNEFRQWRFDMGHPAPEKVKEEEDTKVGPASASGKDHEQLHWIPFFRLDERQKMIVEMRVSPKIKLILWTRFPGATIDRFVPEEDETPPVV